MTAAVVERLTDEEAYLVAILTDPSGLDLAEFTWYEPDAEDGTGCFRAWPFQWKWWRDNATWSVDQCARSVGKSLGICVRAFSFPFRHAGSEMVLTAPELVHLEPIVGLIENRVYSTRLSREMLKTGRSTVTHRPFMMNFANDARLIGRIPQRDGRGVKGIHPLELEQDEAQDYPKAGWKELTETLKRGFEGAHWRAHGVTRGVPDVFFEVTQEKPGNPWRVHRITAMHRPNWTDEERQEKIKQYGSREDPDYRRNILGLHGDATNPLFVLNRLMRCVDKDESSLYNTEEYFRLHIKDTELEYLGADIEDLLDFPRSHLAKYEVFWCGMDVGFTADPSEILVFAEYHPDAAERTANKRVGVAVPGDGLSRLKCVARVSLQRISHPLQVRAILHILDFYKPRAFGMDKTGNGLPLFQAVQGALTDPAVVSDLSVTEARRRLESIKGYNFSEKVIVSLDETIEKPSGVGVDNEDVAREAGIARNVLEYSTDMLREYVDTDRLLLPWTDSELIEEFSGQTFSYSKSPIDSYGRRRRIFSEGRFHALDGARMAAMAHAQAVIEAFVADKPKRRPVLDQFVFT